MALSFADLKKNADALNEKIATDLKNQGGFQEDKDERFWYPAVDKAGNGTSIVRFLPPPEGEDSPFVKLWSHFFKGPTGQWYAENSLTTLGQNDPCSEYNSQLWATEIESNRKQASAQKRKTHYFTNIYIINDTLNPENNGTVRIFKFGTSIFDFIKNKQVPEFADQQPVNVFDFWKGANFRIRIRKDEFGYRKYDRSEFDQAAPLFDDDSKLEEIWKLQYGLQQFIAPDKFKSYDELKRKLDRVLGLGGEANPSARERMRNEPTAEIPQQKQAPSAIEAAAVEEDDDDLDYFKRLSQED